MQRGTWWSLALVASIVGCTVLPGNANDGEACKDEGDCDSGSCIADVCQRDCGVDRDSCKSGWICKKFVRDNIIFQGTSTHYECVATCSACPSTMYCPPSAPNSTPTNECQRKPFAPDVRFEDPGELPLGEPVVLRVNVITSRSPVKTYRWSFNDGTDDVETTVPEVTHTFIQRTNGATTVKVTDQTDAANTTAQQLTFRCAKEGSPCSVEPRGCCVTDTYCLPPSSGGAPACLRTAPLTAKIEGPASAPEGKVTFTVSASANPVSIHWTGSSSLGPVSSTSNLTQTLDLDAHKARYTIRAKVFDSLQRSAEATHEIDICALENQHCAGRFDYNAPCCPGLECSPPPFTKCVKK